MVIDWFTVVAQAVNFLVLVLLLRYFLFRPVVDAIDAREARIADQLSEAATTQADAETKQAELDSKLAVFHEHRTARMAEVEEQAEQEQERLIQVARTAADGLSTKRHRALVNEERMLREEVGNRVVHEVFAIARQVLSELTGTSLEARTAAIFAKRLDALDEAATRALATAVGAGTAVVRTAFDLPSEQREEIRRALCDALSVDVSLQFETAPALVSGIELSASGQKLGWSIASYLDALHRGAAELLSDVPEADDHGE